MKVLYPSGQVGISRRGFSRREENLKTETKTLRARQDPTCTTKLNPHVATGQNRTWATMVEGMCSLHYTIPAPYIIITNEASHTF